MVFFKGVKDTHQRNKQKRVTRKKRGLISLFFETVLEIIEDKREYNIPVNAYCLLIAVYMLQIGGYIFQSDSLNSFQEEKMQTLGLISEASTGTYFLFLIGQENIIIWLFAIMQMLMYAYIVYLLVITFGKRFVQEEVMQKTQKMRQVLNRILNIYFLVYIWVFSIPNMEINAGIASCGNDGYLVQYNGDKCNKKPIVFFILSSLGLVFTAATVLILLFFFRNYEFDDANILKRRFKAIQVVQLCFYLLTIFSYFVKIIPTFFIFIFIHIIALTYLYDSVVNIPFRNQKLGSFYASASIMFLFLVFIFTLWYYEIFFPDKDILYTVLIIGAVLVGSFSQIWSYRYTQIMGITSSNFERYQEHFDFYLEQLFRLGQNSSISEKDKFYLFELIIYHQSNCLDVQCYCKITTFKDEKDNLVREDLYKLIDSLFIWSLSQTVIIKNMANLEHVSLKFITYLTKYRNNSFRAYYYLKSIIAKNDRLSLYFMTLSSILSKKIETDILHSTINNLRQKSNENQYTLQRKQINLIIQTDIIQSTFLPQLISFVESKLEYYTLLKERETQSLQGFSELTLKVCQQAMTIKDLFTNLILKNENISTLKKTYRISKLKQIYSCVVLNELFASVQDEIHLNDLIRNDQNKHLEMVSNISVLRRDVLTIKVSISKSRGEIISNNLKNVATFFGYSSQDTHKVKNINSLMPKIFSDIHDYFINNSIQRGHSKLFEQKLQTFAVNQQRLLVPVNIYLSYNFDVYNDCCISGTIVKRDTNNSYILFDQFGSIIGMTDKVFHKIFKQTPKKEGSNFQTSFPDSQQVNSFQNSSLPIEQFFKGIDPTGVYNKFSIFLLIPQIIRIIRKQYKEAEMQSEYTHNKDPLQNKFSASLCLNKVYKIRIPFNYLELSNKLSQTANPSHYNSDKMNYSTKNGQDKSFDFQSFYKAVSSFCKKNTKFYEDSDNCYKELDMVFNLQFFEYFYEQNHQLKKRSFYCIEIIELVENASDSRLNFLQKVAPLLDDSKNHETLENTIESSRLSYQKSQTMNQKFEQFSDNDEDQQVVKKELEIVCKLIQPQHKDELSPNPSIKHYDEVTEITTDRVEENSRTSNPEYQQSPYFTAQQQKNKIPSITQLAQVSTSDQRVRQQSPQGSISIQKEGENKSIHRNVQKKKKDISKQLTFEPQSSVNQSQSLYDMIEQVQQKEDIQIYDEMDAYHNRDIQFYQEIDQNNLYEQNIQIQKRQRQRVDSPSKRYQWDAKLQNESFQQKQGQMEDDNDYKIPLEILHIEQKENNSNQLISQQNMYSMNDNNDKTLHTNNNFMIDNNKLHSDSYQNIDDYRLSSMQHMMYNNNNNNINNNDQSPSKNTRQDESLYNQIEEYSTRKKSIQKEYLFEYNTTTPRVLIQQNYEDLSSRTHNEQLEITQDINNLKNNQDSKSRQKQMKFTQKNQWETGIHQALTKRSNSFQKNEIKEQMLKQQINQQNSSQHSLTSMLRNSNNRLIYQIHDSVYSHEIMKIFNLLSGNSSFIKLLYIIIFYYFEYGSTIIVQNIYLNNYCEEYNE